MRLHTFQKGVSMKRSLQFLMVLAGAAMMNGCSKCSGERPAEAPPAAVEAAPPAEAPAPDAGATTAPAEGTEAAPAEAK
jgi:hypothetical protein